MKLDDLRLVANKLSLSLSLFLRCSIYNSGCVSDPLILIMAAATYCHIISSMQASVSKSQNTPCCTGRIRYRCAQCKQWL